MEKELQSSAELAPDPKPTQSAANCFAKSVDNEQRNWRIWQGLEGLTKAEEQLLCQLAHNGAAHATLWRKERKTKSNARWIENRGTEGKKLTLREKKKKTWKTGTSRQCTYIRNCTLTKRKRRNNGKVKNPSAEATPKGQLSASPSVCDSSQEETRDPAAPWFSHLCMHKLVVNLNAVQLFS